MRLTTKQINEIAQELDIGMKVFINKDTLEIKSILDWEDIGDSEFWEEEMEEIDKKWTNFAVIEKMESWEAFQVMEGFIELVEDKYLSEELSKILTRRSPFANFKAEIESSPYRQNWFDYKQSRFKEYVIKNLKEEGFEIEKSTST
jgi:hypothetical protein